MSDKGVSMDADKTLEQIRENMKIINETIVSYENGTLDKDKAGAIVYERLFGDPTANQLQYK